MRRAATGHRSGFRIAAAPVWMQAVLAPALARYRQALPAVELALRTAPFAEGLRLLENGESDLHCGGADPGRPLPAFLRRERFIELTAAIVAGDGHQLLTRRNDALHRPRHDDALEGRRGAAERGSSFPPGRSLLPCPWPREYTCVMCRMEGLRKKIQFARLTRLPGSGQPSGLATRSNVTNDEIRPWRATVSPSAAGWNRRSLRPWHGIRPQSTAGRPRIPSPDMAPCKVSSWTA